MLSTFTAWHWLAQLRARRQRPSVLPENTYKNGLDLIKKQAESAEVLGDIFSQHVYRVGSSM